MDMQRLSEIKARCEAASYAGVLDVDVQEEFEDAEKTLYLLCTYLEEQGWTIIANNLWKGDAELFANARQDIPDLMAEVERLTTILNSVCHWTLGEDGLSEWYYTDCNHVVGQAQILGEMFCYCPFCGLKIRNNSPE